MQKDKTEPMADEQPAKPASWNDNAEKIIQNLMSDLRRQLEICQQLNLSP